jgi:ribosomal protein S18 acetylase RimI-like enzyme
VLIREIRPDEWRELRDLRLRALADAPTAFEARLEAERAQPDEIWKERAQSWGGPVGTVIVTDDLSAMCVGVRDGEDARLGALWVEPSRRGCGVATRLVDGVLAWSRKGGARRIVAGVAEGNEVAASLLRRHGFVLTRRRETLRPGLTEIEFERGL